ncbi:hypothetical protein HYH03_014591 [Edaphochlamys debaryana]|uniref:Kazal-like domain-containing protein n=1 Tax=Edaphochlamys debaryana TaxID=47281 RepID=A0A836BS54_9CHLO|nr:hypothetical protein HYH03_014591 [Edaphochlamys debaryana]|eukprot:KAG2486792.1 hypothetical protein HYH03_014591 [Edaphochlamys debaryana]
MIYAPVCVNGKTYGNLCMARCALGQGIHYTQGECPVVDLNPIPKNCPSRIAVKCMDTVNPATKEVVPCNGPYKPGSPNGALPVCPTKKTVYCFADPCQVSSCPAHPDAACYSSYCAVARSYQGVPWGPCGALYLDSTGKAIKDCYSLEVSDITHAAIYRGVELPGCTPIFYDPVTGNLLDCTPKNRRHLRAAAREVASPPVGCGHRSSWQQSMQLAAISCGAH